MFWKLKLFVFSFEKRLDEYLYIGNAVSMEAFSEALNSHHLELKDKHLLVLSTLNTGNTSHFEIILEELSVNSP